jgi:hypothetical protein
MTSSLTRRYRYLGLAALLIAILFTPGMVVQAQAQAPSIGGVANNGSSQTYPLYWNSYISIYGQNLSNGSGSSVILSVPHQVCDANGFCFGTTYTYVFNSSNGGSFWYESGGQINVYVPIQIFDLNGNQSIYPAQISVRNSSGQFSNAVIGYFTGH